MPDPFSARPVATITPSNVKHLLACSKRFYTLYVKKQWPDRENNSFSAFGLAFHSVLAQVYNPANVNEDTHEQLDAWISNAFFRFRYASQDDRKQDMRRCKQMVVGYMRSTEDDDPTETLSTERPVDRTDLLNGEPVYTLSGRLDRVLARENADGTRTAVALDYKTGAVKIDSYESVMLCWLLKIAYPDFDHYEVQYDFIDSDGRVTRDTHTTAQLKGLQPLIKRRAIEVLKSEEHPAEPGEHCIWCPLRPTCQPSRGIEVDIEQDDFE